VGRAGNTGQRDAHACVRVRLVISRRKKSDWEGWEGEGVAKAEPAKGQTSKQNTHSALRLCSAPYMNADITHRQCASKITSH